MTRLVKDPTLHRYWIELRGTPGRSRFGVTAIDVADALGLIERSGMCDMPMPVVEALIEDVDVESIRDDNDALVNMAPPSWRGIWYPDDSRSYWASSAPV